MYVCMYVCVYLTHLPLMGCKRRSIFKWSKGLNSTFSFSQIGCLIKTKEPNQPNYVTINTIRTFLLNEPFTPPPAVNQCHKSQLIYFLLTHLGTLKQF